MSTEARVVILDFIDDDLAPERKVLGDSVKIEALAAKDVSQFDQRVEQADAVMMYHFLEVGREQLQRWQRCRLIVRCGVGFDNVDRQAAADLGIPVANIPDYGTEEVADAALGMMLSSVRGITALNQRLREVGRRWHYDCASPIHRLRDRVVGIVGCGRIGTAFSRRCLGLGMKVKFHDPYVPDGWDKALGVERCETLEELLASSHVVSLHCPLTDETHHLIDDRTLAVMRPGSFLVNTSRGAVVDTDAVVRSLAAGHLAGAALDVLPKEPPRDDDPLLVALRDPSHPAHDRLILTPHSAFYSEEGLLDMRIKGAQNIARVLRGEKPRNVVNGVLEPRRPRA